MFVTFAISEVFKEGEKSREKFGFGSNYRHRHR